MGIFAASGFWLIRHEVHLIHVGIGDSHNRFECNDASRTFLHRSGANDEDGASGKLGLSMFDVEGGAKAVNDKSDQDQSRAGIDEYIVVCSHKHKFFVLNKRPVSFEFFDIFDRKAVGTLKQCYPKWYQSLRVMKHGNTYFAAKRFHNCTGRGKQQSFERNPRYGQTALFVSWPKHYKTNSYAVIPRSENNQLRYFGHCMTPVSS